MHEHDFGFPVPQSLHRYRFHYVPVILQAGNKDQCTEWVH